MDPVTSELDTGVPVKVKRVKVWSFTVVVKSTLGGTSVTCTPKRLTGTTCGPGRSGGRDWVTKIVPRTSVRFIEELWW